ncbi:site-specific DNA-methyltransferase [Candidatus Bathyarchaeota archaeon]|nr:site-specific DNA-methyltransferase [Candidatus Bathyarchaeota archaeon]
MANTSKDGWYYKSLDNRSLIIKGDILEIKTVDAGSIDLVVTSPPYNVDVKYGDFKDDIPYGKYLEFTNSWMERVHGLMKDDGRFCLNIPLDKNKGGQQSVYADVIHIAKKVGFKYHSTVVWNEGNISRRTAWGSWMSASAPYVIAPVELIAILYKDKWKKSRKGESTISRDEFLEWTNGLWTFSGESKKRVGHPAPYPVELPDRCIKLFSYKDDVILDPFMGSGTTLLASRINDRTGIGVDISTEYCELAKERIEKIINGAKS